MGENVKLKQNNWQIIKADSSSIGNSLLRSLYMG